MGLGDMFDVCDKCARHKNVNFPGHKHASLYDIATIGPAVRRVLDEYNITVVTNCRIIKANLQNGIVKSIESQGGRVFSGKVFIDTTGTAGPMNNCTKYGNGCAMCILRCPTFGGRQSLSALCGVREINGKKADDSYGTMSGSCKLHKDSLSDKIKDMLNKDGVAVIPLPQDLIKSDLSRKACQQYALTEYAENIILLDTGHAKMMTPYFNLEYLRRVPGFENARYEDPYSGGIGNSMRYFGIVPRDNTLKVKGVKNLFCAGEKAGTIVGHTEAICTGALAGHNSTRYIAKMDLLTLPEQLAIGDIIAYVGKQMETADGLTKKYTFSGSVYFERMKERGLYTTDVDEIKSRVKAFGMENIFGRKVLD